MCKKDNYHEILIFRNDDNFRHFFSSSWVIYFLNGINCQKIHKKQLFIIYSINVRYV